MVQKTVESVPTHASYHGLSPCVKDENGIQRSDRGMLTNIRLLAEAPNSNQQIDQERGLRGICLQNDWGSENCM